MKEEDIRPAELFNEYLRLSAEDAERLFSVWENAMVERPCPGCGKETATPRFVKHGFTFAACNRCDTLFALTVPTEEQLSHLYRDSKSARYWAEVFFPSVNEVRRKKIFRPRVIQALDKLSKLGVGLSTVVDVGAGTGIFLDELKHIMPDVEARAVEPGVALAEICREKGYDTYEGFISDAAENPRWQGVADLVTSFEVIEHLLDPMRFIADVSRLLKPGGIVLVTGLCGDGFDIRTLGERSKSVSPPHHLNFLSRRGAEGLVRRAGLELVEFATPGRLDVDIVKNAMAENDNAVEDPFLRMLLIQSGPEAQNAFQRFLAENGLSSHMWIYARRSRSSGI